MNSLPSAGHRLFFFLTLLVVISACSSGASDLRLSADDTANLNRIYETSPWVVRQSKLDFQVREGGVIEINIQGEALRKPDREGEMWLPILLVRDLPEYFQGYVGDTQKPIELESYRIPGGLWVVTAVVSEVPDVSQSSSATPTASPSSPKTSQSSEAISSNTQQSAGSLEKLQAPTTINLRVLMFSPQFSTGFPFLVPVGQTRRSVDASISLPSGAGFSSLEIKGSDEAATRSSSFTVLPPSFTGKAASAATRLSPESTVAWNFSGVTYRLSSFGVWRPWFAPSVVLILLTGFTLWWGFEQVGRKRWVSSPWKSRNKLLSDLEEDLRDLSVLPKAFKTEAPNFASQWGQQVSKIINLLPEFHGRQFNEPISTALHQVKELDRQLREYELKSPYDSAILVIYRLRLKQLESTLDALHDVNREFSYRHSKKETLKRSGFWVLSAAVLASMLWLLSTFAKGQTKPKPPPTKAVTSIATLGDLGVNLDPQDPHSANYDKVNVALSFFPLTEVQSSKGEEEIGIGTGRSANVTIEPLQLPANSRATILQETGNLVRLNVPTSNAPMIQRLKALAEWKPVEFIPPPDYFKSLDAGNKVTVNYVLKGAQRVSERTKGGFFHWFPWDTMSVELPLELQQPAIVSNIQLHRPSLDYVASPSAEGVTIPFVESDDGRDYQSSSKEKEGRTVIWARSPVTVRALFERTFFQRIGLTVGQVIGALVIAGVLGWWTKAKTIGKFLVTAFVFISFFWAFRTVVLNYYSNLPTIVTVQGITLFETLALANVVLIFGIGLLVRWKLSL